MSEKNTTAQSLDEIINVLFHGRQAEAAHGKAASEDKSLTAQTLIPRQTASRQPANLNNTERSLKS